MSNDDNRDMDIKENLYFQWNLILAIARINNMAEQWCQQVNIDKINIPIWWASNKRTWIEI